MKNTSKLTLEEALDMLDDTFKLLLKHQGPFKITPEIKADINKLQNFMLHYKEYEQKIVEELNIDFEGVKSEILASSNLKPSDKQLIKHAEDIENKAKILKSISDKMLKKKSTKNPQKKAQDKQLKERRKLFKPLGGDKNWIPL